LDMRLAESFIPAVEHSAGRVEIGASIKGTFEDPLLVGSADVKDARLTLKGQPIAMRAVSGHVEFSEARVLLQEVRGILNEGRAELRGDFILEKRSLKHFELGMQLDEVAYRPVEDLPLVVSGELLLYGKPNAVVLSGDLDILKLRYEKDFELGSLLQTVRRGRFGEGGGERPYAWLSFDVKVRATGDVRVDNNLAKAKLLGNLRLTGNNLEPGLLGTVEAAAGSQAFFRGNEFNVTQGLLEFREKNSVDALFDIHAETQVREHLIRLHAFGRPNDPKVLLTSEPELSESDILSLLTLGVTSRDRSNTAQTSAGLAAEALLNVSGLDRQLQRFLPKNAVIRDLSFHLSTTYNSASGVVEPTAQFESKFLTEQLTLGMTQPVLGRGTRANAEYRFDNRLSAQAQWDNENNVSSLGNLGLDLKFRWEWE
jgi:translocation and assembly module TamB